MTVYSYGRYAALDKEKGILNNTNISGQGVLLRLTGQDAVNFVNKYVNEDGAEAYEITSANESSVCEIRDNYFSAFSAVPKTGKYKGDARARVVDKYNLFDNNCTTKTEDALKASEIGLDFKTTTIDFIPSTVPGIGTTVKSTDDVNTPGEMQDYLSGESKYGGGTVKNVTNDVKKEVQ